MTDQFTTMGQALGVIGLVMYPDTMSVMRSTVTKGTSGGNIQGTPTATTPSGIPVRYRPASGREITLAGKALSGTVYMLNVPASFSDALIDVDATCTAVIAARVGGEPSRTFKIQWVGRFTGIEIQLLASIEG